MRLPFLYLAALLTLAACSTDSRKTESRQPSSEEPAEKSPGTAPAPDLPDSLAAPRVGTADGAADPATRPAARALPAADTSRADGFYDAFGRYLAGLPARPGAPLPDTALTSRAWRTFRATTGAKWRQYTRSHTAPIRQWSAQELDSVATALPTVFYPFSGPDLLNVHSFFPQAETYVMIGLEPVGALPTPAVLQQPGIFKMTQGALWSVLNFSFFRTISMEKDFKSAELDGTLPILLLFAARTGHRVVNAQLVHLTPTGALAESAAREGSPDVPGSRLTLVDSTGRAQTVYYFSADISDGHLSQAPGLLPFIGSLGPVATFVKSASYLMHKAYFSRIRNTVLRQSDAIVQDDSGIAFDYFPPGQWRFTPYGHYSKPISLFAKHYQDDLKQLYRDSVHRPHRLPFGTGYNWRPNESNLLLAVRRGR